ncbi:amidohydrolase family protein [Chloroflexota bacterium]
MGNIIDTHAHLDPPNDGNINESSLMEIVQSIDSAGVGSIIVMPVPNEGMMPYSSLGMEQRIMLRQIGGDRIKVFCGSEYISNWLHDRYRSGHSESELNEVLNRLSEDMDNPECSGVGEIGLYHFNKTGTQNVIEYPPTFEPYLRIIGLVAEKGNWLDLHAEPVDPDGKSYEDQVFGGLELLFQKYPNLKLILSHTAMTNPTNVRKILETYPNIMMNFKPITNHKRWRNLEPITNPGGLLYSDWAELFEEMPDRFMVGTDEKFGRIHKDKRTTEGVPVIKYEEDIKHMRSILSSLNSDAAELIAYQNAERIFN